ncbi:uncharacterized protein LOC123899916 [Trifolium pratense]|uniref:Uncharacterized protein n=2 Tax=Trifolium pratense TaxID=57577 RepID=A0ACB0JEM7_TRIPR|nr:uncharacterized protein LOC123899916 [Trifolium pratense]CAJ2642757.1 unnamed protein product [Trifolium pratense]
MEDPATPDENGGGMTLEQAVQAFRALQEEVQKERQEREKQEKEKKEESPEEGVQETAQPLAQELWDTAVPPNLKMPHLPSFDGKSDPLEHLMAVNTQTAIIGADEHLKCKLLSGTFKDAALRWYMNLPKNSITGYVDFHKKLLHQFAGSKYIQVTATTLFGLRQGHKESLREYLARFSEATIKVSNPNQEMFVAAFHNGLKAGQFNESLAQKPAITMQEVMKRAECYIKGEESNAEKRSRDSRENPSDKRSPDRHQRRSSRRSSGQSSRYSGRPYREPWSSSRGYRTEEEYSRLNDTRVHILDEILNAGLARLPPAPDRQARMGPNPEEWCHYHRCKGHDTEKCYRLKDLIEQLLNSGHLRKFLQKAAAAERGGRSPPASPRKTTEKEDSDKDQKRIAVNTIAGGFAGGGESRAARKRYLRQIIYETSLVGQVSFPTTPELSFSANDGNGIFPHDDDPLVIQVQILNCDVKRVLIDSGSSADIMYWEAFKAMQLAGELLKPHNGTLIGFSGEQVEVMGHITLLTTFGEKENAKTIKVRYLVVKTPFTSYNIIIGRPAFNTLGAAMSTLYLSMKYPLDNGRVGMVRGDQALGRQCYESSLRVKHIRKSTDQVNTFEASNFRIESADIEEVTDLDPREEFKDQRVSPIENLEPVQIGSAEHQVTYIGTQLNNEEKERIVATLRSNVDLFAWKPSDMPGIDESIITHKLAISPKVKPVSQRKRKVGEERRTAIDEEVSKLKEAGFIEEIKYPEWLANVVLVKKANGKWRMCVDFTDLNKACPKDPYPLPNIDRLIDGTSGYKMLSFMDAYSGYNQIRMNALDAPHTAFMSNTCNYNYRVMPFGLKNAGATYQRLMDRIFARQIGKNLEVYIDDMVIKTVEGGSHQDDLKDILASVRKFNMRLNPAKCSFGVQAGKFLGFMLTNRGIEANPEKCQAIINMRSPSSVKEVQQLTGRIAALSRFLSCAGEKAFHFFAALKKGERFCWTENCEEAFQQLKQFLASPLILTRPQADKPLQLYLAVSDNAMSSALVQEIGGEEKPVYFVSRVFQGAEMRYQKLERLALAVVITARRLRQYFQSHAITVKTDYPIKCVLQKPDLAGRMVAWAIELSEYDITFVPRGSIKSQILADFVLESTSPPAEVESHTWTLSVDGSSNLKGSGAGIVLEGPDGVLVEQSLRFAFRTSNNQAEYEALIAGMKLAKEMEVRRLKAKSDSQLVTSQVSGEFQAKDPQLIKYLHQVKSLSEHFDTFELLYVPREQNARADLLSKLASTKKPGNNKTVIQETISKPSFGDSDENGEVLATQVGDDWRMPIMQYLQKGELPEDKEAAVRLRRKAAHYTLISGRLYKRGFSSPMLLCVNEEEAKGILKEIHEGSCGSHIGGRSLAGKVARAGFFWPTLLKDASDYVKSCDTCQRHADLHHAPGEPLTSVTSPWPFYMWGVDILGPFPASEGQAKFLLVAVDYFTKWIEAEPVPTIGSERVKKFYWKNIICRFGLPKYIVSDNGTQFTSEAVITFCQEKGIRNTFISVEHPQANGQAESANKVILKAIKRRLEGKKTGWVEHLLPVLWSYHTTVQSTTGETPFRMVYGTDAMIPAEINPPSWRRSTLTATVNEEALKENLDLLEETREAAHIREFSVKQQARRKYETRVMARDFKAGDLVLKRPMGRDKGGKLAPNWEGPYRIQEAFGRGAYRLETLKGEALPRTWNVVNLRAYYS